MLLVDWQLLSAPRPRAQVWYVIRRILSVGRVGREGEDEVGWKLRLDSKQNFHQQRMDPSKDKWDLSSLGVFSQGDG